MNPRTPEDEKLRAGEAAAVLNTPIFQEACRRIEEGLASQRRGVPIRDTDMHTRLIIAEQLWSGIKDYLEQVVQTGKMVEFEIQRQKSLREKVTSLWR